MAPGSPENASILGLDPTAIASRRRTGAMAEAQFASTEVAVVVEATSTALPPARSVRVRRSSSSCSLFAAQYLSRGGVPSSGWVVAGGDSSSANGIRTHASSPDDVLNINVLR